MSTQIAEFNQTETALAVLREKYTDIPDCTTKEGYEECRVGIGELRTLRTTLDKTRKQLNADDQARIKFRNTEAKRITAELTKLEDPMKAAKQAIDEAEEREKQAAIEAERKRVDDIWDRINQMSECKQAHPNMRLEEIEEHHERIKALREYDFQEFDEQAHTEYMKATEHLKKILIIHKEQAEERKRLEEDRQKLLEEKARIDEEKRKEVEAAKAAQAKAEAERKEALEKLRKAEEERLEAERAKEEEERKEHERKEMAERVAAEAKRQESLRPDKEKLRDWVAKIRFIDAPEGLRSEEGRELALHFTQDLDALAKSYLNNLENL